MQKKPVSEDNTESQVMNTLQFRSCELQVTSTNRGKQGTNGDSERLIHRALSPGKRRLTSAIGGVNHKKKIPGHQDKKGVRGGYVSIHIYTLPAQPLRFVHCLYHYCVHCLPSLRGSVAESCEGAVQPELNPVYMIQRRL